MSRNTPRRELATLGAGGLGGESTDWTEEDSISSRLYDQPKKYEGFKDDKDQRYKGTAFRHLTNWSLADSRRASTSRISLPRNNRKHFNTTLHVCLYGELEPNDAESKKQKVVIRRLRHWVMDCSRSTRGIWVLAGHWYKLKQPDQEQVQLPDGRLLSQEKIHEEMRAVFGLFSNIVDMLLELKGGHGLSLVNYLTSFHRNHTPKQSHDALLPSEDQKEGHPELNDVPFDMNLLRREACIIRYDLRNLDDCLTIKSPFMAGLYQMEKEYISAVKRAEPWTIETYDYLKSAKDSENRSQQTPWGDPVPNAMPVRPNQLLELGVPTSYDSTFCTNWAREHEPAAVNQTCSSGSYTFSKPTRTLSKPYESKVAGLVPSSASPLKRPPTTPTSCGSTAKRARLETPHISSAPLRGKTPCPHDSSDSEESSDSSGSDSSSGSVASADSDRLNGPNSGASSRACGSFTNPGEIDDFSLPGIRFSSPYVDDKDDDDSPPVKPKRKRKKGAAKKSSPPPAQDGNRSAPVKPKRGYTRVQKPRKTYVSAVAAQEALCVLESYVLQGGDSAGGAQAPPRPSVREALVFIGEELFMLKLHADLYEDDAEGSSGCDDDAPSGGRKYVCSFEAKFALKRLAEYTSTNSQDKTVGEMIVILRGNLFPDE